MFYNTCLLQSPNVEFSLCLNKHHTMRTYWVSGGVAPRILNRTYFILVSLQCVLHQIISLWPHAPSRWDSCFVLTRINVIQVLRDFT